MSKKTYSYAARIETFDEGYVEANSWHEANLLARKAVRKRLKDLGIDLTRFDAVELSIKDIEFEGAAIISSR